jgi:Putative zinc-finger
VSEQRCPSEADLLRFVDADLSPEQLQRVEQHAATCSVCGKQLAALRTLILDVAAGPELRFDIAEHVGAVMARLDEPARPARSARLSLWGGLLAAAAALVLGVFIQGGQFDSNPQFVARGAPAVASLSRDVGVQLYAQEQSLRPLEAGSHIRPGVALTAGLRNLGSEGVYLLLFAIDAQRVVHWIAPGFLSADSDPQAVSIVPSTSERLLPTAAVFDDLAPGAMSIVAIITREPRRVSEIESLTASELSAESLVKRFARAEVRQFSLDVAP